MNDVGKPNMGTAGVPQPVLSGAQKKILLVDDDSFLVDMYSVKFKAAGYDVQGCISAEEALQVLRGGFRASVIVFDLIMPEHDGFYFLDYLQKERLEGSALLIALTNESDDAVHAKVMELGVSRLIVKANMIPSEVVNAVAEEIAKSRQTGTAGVLTSP